MSKSAEMEDRCTIIDSIGIANPRFVVPQKQAAEFMLNTAGLAEPLRKRIPQVYEKSAIERRFTCLEDYTKAPSQFEFYPPTPSMKPSPSTADRNKVYERESIPLAAAAARNCLAEADIEPSDITHLIVVSCTGFFAPGIDIHLVKELGIRTTVERTIIGFMGCYAAFIGLKSAASICRSSPDANVLVVCVELCTLHFQIEDSLESVIVNALFSDGSAACLLRQVSEADAVGKLIYRNAATQLVEQSLDAMSWNIGDTGFAMGLSPKVPELISGHLPNFLKSLTGASGLSAADIDFWAVHPGGRQVLDRTAATLQLSEKALADSYSILRDYGNMSSPTVLFILKRIIERRKSEDYGFGVALAFGPGLTIEGCLLGFGVPRV